MSKSVERVRQAAITRGLQVEVRRMGESTRTAEEAAAQCGVAAGQIVKSLIFKGSESEKLYLFLVAGDRRLDQEKAVTLVGEALVRADPREIRDRTGFAIGGVAPIGHTGPVEAYADRRLATYDVVWAAAGAHDAVFSCEPNALIAAADAQLADIAV